MSAKRCDGIREDSDKIKCLITTHKELQLLELPGIWRDYECRTKLKRLRNHKIYSRKDIFCTMEKADLAVCSVCDLFI